MFEPAIVLLDSVQNNILANAAGKTGAQEMKDPASGQYQSQPSGHCR
jgi:hypothetical protein